MDRIQAIALNVRLGSWYPAGAEARITLLQAVRTFAVRCGDLELEGQTDRWLEMEINGSVPVGEPNGSR